MPSRAQRWAAFVVHSGLSYTPDQYLALTASERAAVADEIRRATRGR